MNGNASVSQYIFASVAQWLRHWPVLTGVVGYSPVIGKDFIGFSL